MDPGPNEQQSLLLSLLRLNFHLFRLMMRQLELELDDSDLETQANLVTILRNGNFNGSPSNGPVNQGMLGPPQHQHQAEYQAPSSGADIEGFRMAEAPYSYQLYESSAGTIASVLLVVWTRRTKKCTCDLLIVWKSSITS
jgi:hypothetical protein